ncbi:MAG: enoyl-CoA hydratase/isomerase family protein [Chloroflexi bacterium]|nr:enoyl-CoA hydratase/isomerase family protein [Chloroflexota bacterium]
MAYSTILYEKQHHGALLTLNRPETLNALSAAMEDEIHHALDEAERDPEVRAIVLTGAGRAFSSGIDQTGGGGARRGQKTVWPYGLPEGRSIAEQLDEARMRSTREGMRRTFHIWELTKPVIAAVNGWCMGAGTFYALVCHMTIAADTAVFAQPEIRGISSTSFLWVLNAGYKNALRYALTGDHIDAQEALRIGLVNKVVPEGQLLQEAFHVVERIALVSPETVKINLAIATMGLEMMGFRNAMALNAEYEAMGLSSLREDYRKYLDDAMREGGLRAFLQARDGPFQPEPFGPRSQPRK